MLIYPMSGNQSVITLSRFTIDSEKAAGFSIIVHLRMRHSRNQLRG